MAAAEPDAIEAARLAAAQTLPAECADDFQRLSRSLVYGPTFQWLLVEAPDENLRRQVIGAIETVLRAAKLRSATLPLSSRMPDVGALEGRLVRHARQSAVVHVLGAPGWFDAARWDAFNVRRERIAANARARLVFWLDAHAIEAASRAAPDLWAWRAGVYQFVHQSIQGFGPSRSAPMPVELPSRSDGLDWRSLNEKLRRIDEIRTWLADSPPEDLRGGPLHELGRLLFGIGDYDAALVHWRNVERPYQQAQGDERAVAIVSGQVADILQARGELDEALRIRKEEQLSVFERLGDVHAKAVTMGKIADIFQTRGQLDEALRIRNEEELPVYERLGDVRGKAIALGRVADILQARGQFDEALRIRHEKELPVYERLGDVHSKAVTMGQIADILQARGQFDEALRIRNEEQLPVYERLGDVRAKAVTMGKIAEILQNRGQIDEALRILREDVLPVVEGLGEVRGRALTQARIGGLLLSREPPDRSTAEPLLQQAFADLRRLNLPEAQTIYQFLIDHGFQPSG